MTRTAAVIGAGFGGLALAIRLQSAGIATTLIEARDKPGGRAYLLGARRLHLRCRAHRHHRSGLPPGIVGALSGQRIERDVSAPPGEPLLPAELARRHQFRLFQRRRTAARTRSTRLNPKDVAGYRRFLEYAAGVYHEGYEKLGHAAFLDFGSMIRAAPALAKYQAWRSVYSIVSPPIVEDERLRQALSFHTLLVGGNPMTTSAIYALIHKLEKLGGVWFAKGGTNRLVAGMVHPVRAAGRHDAAGRSGGGDRDARRSGHGRSHPERLARRMSMRSPLTPTSCTAIAICWAAPRAAGKCSEVARSQALLAFVVRGPFRAARHVARHSPPHDPVRPALWPAAEGHLR